MTLAPLTVETAPPGFVLCHSGAEPGRRILVRAGSVESITDAGGGVSVLKIIGRGGRGFSVRTTIEEIAAQMRPQT